MGPFQSLAFSFFNFGEARARNPRKSLLLWKGPCSAQLILGALEHSIVERLLLVFRQDHHDGELFGPREEDRTAIRGAGLPEPSSW